MKFLLLFLTLLVFHFIAYCNGVLNPSVFPVAFKPNPNKSTSTTGAKSKPSLSLSSLLKRLLPQNTINKNDKAQRKPELYVSRRSDDISASTGKGNNNGLKTSATSTDVRGYSTETVGKAKAQSKFGQSPSQRGGIFEIAGTGINMGKVSGVQEHVGERNSATGTQPANSGGTPGTASRKRLFSFSLQKSESSSSTKENNRFYKQETPEELNKWETKGEIDRREKARKVRERKMESGDVKSTFTKGRNGRKPKLDTIVEEDEEGEEMKEKEDGDKEENEENKEEH